MLELNLLVRSSELFFKGRNICFLESKLCKTNTPTWPAFDPEQTSNNSVLFVLKKSKLKNIRRADTV